MREIITNFVELFFIEYLFLNEKRFFELAKWHRIFSTPMRGSKFPPYAAA